MRVRTTLGATLVVGLALVLGGALFLQVVHSSLTDSTTRVAEVRAQELVALLARELTPGDLPLESDSSAFAQVLDRSGRVVAASADVAGRGPLVAARSGVVTLDPGPIGDGEAFVVAARHTGDLRWTVLAGRSLEPVADGTEIVTTALLASLPLLMFLVAGTAWVLTGRALQPVEAVRREVAAISGAQLDRRVPVPPGEDEVARLAVTMNEMLERLERARTTQQRFVADASHELRNPLAALRSQLEVASAHPEHTSLEELVTDLLAESVRLGLLVEDLLLLARSDEGLRPSPGRTVDVDDLVLAEADRLRREAKVTVDTSSVGAARVVGDPAGLGRLVRNLMDNAERHARGHVVLVLQAAGDQVRLEVVDDGPGIAPDDRERVFERFTRLDEARSRDVGGTGLGLAIVREVARSHGGTVQVADGPGGRFVVLLPLAR